MFTGWRVVHVGGYKCLLAGKWCMLVAINVYLKNCLRVDTIYP